MMDVSIFIDEASCVAVMFCFLPGYRPFVDQINLRVELHAYVKSVYNNLGNILFRPLDLRVGIDLGRSSVPRFLPL